MPCLHKALFVGFIYADGFSIDGWQTFRSIRDQISKETIDMTFEQGKAYLDKLLAEKATASNEYDIAKDGTAE